MGRGLEGATFKRGEASLLRTGKEMEGLLVERRASGVWSSGVWR